MAANNKVNTEELACGLCSEYYTDPLMLPCLHSFCKKCLIKVKEEQGREESLKCPTCDDTVPLPSGKIESDLTQNLWLAHKVMKAFVKEKISGKESIPCNQCDDAAVAFCCSCCSFLCDFCKKGHKRIKKTTQHELIELGGKKVFEGGLPNLSRQPVYCTHHEDEKLKFYCQDCETLICRDCIIITHKDHKYHDYVEEGDAAREALKQIGATCNEAKLLGTFAKSIANGEKMMQQIDTRKEEVKKEIEETFETLKAALEDRCKELLAETEEIANNKKASVKKQLGEFRRIENGVLLGCQLAGSVSECVDSGEVLSIKKLITDRLEECLVACKEEPREINENEVIMTQLKATDMSNEIRKFGGVFEIDPALISIDTGLAIPLATVEKERKFKLAIDATLPLDKTTKHLRASFIKDGSEEEGRVVIANDNNTAIVSCTPQSIGQYELSLTVRGHHIKGSPYRLSVKASRNYDSLTNQKCYSVGNYTYGVAVHTNGEVFAFNSSYYFVQVLSQDGSQIRTIGSSGNGDGQFSTPFSLLLVGDRLYVSDSGLDHVQYFSATTGGFIGKFGSRGNGEGQFSNPYGMATDGKGKILVADYNNNRVQVFEEDGTFVHAILCKGNASDVAVDNEGNIYVTIYNLHCVQVFSPDGENELDTYRNPNSCFQYPSGIAIDDEGYIFIMTFDCSTCYLYVLSPQKTHVKLMSLFHNIYYVHGIALDKDGCVYVADYWNSHVLKY